MDNKTIKLEQDWGELSANWALNTTSPLRFMVFTFPTSCRTPEGEDCFHPALFKKAIFSQLLHSLKLLIRGCGVFTLKRFGNFKYIKDNGSFLTIAPRTIVNEDKEEISTNYLVEEDIKNSDWLIFSEGQKSEQPFVNRIKIFFVFLQLTQSLLLNLLKKPSHIGLYTWWLGHLLNFNHLISLRWSDRYHLFITLNNILNDNNYKLIHSPHEFHPHAKVIWEIGKRKSIKTSSIQHAASERFKLWLFPTKHEISAGMATPQIMFCYNNECKNWWKDLLPESTQFYLGHGPRFKNWKDVEKFSPATSNNLLFVSSLAWWDNEVIIQSVEKLSQIEDARNYSFILRLHPHAQLNDGQKSRIQNLLKKPNITKDTGDLKESVKSSKIVFGMSSTVLEEALLMGRNAVSIQHHDYLFFGTSLIKPYNFNDLSKIPKLDELNSSHEKAYEKLGLNSPTASLSDLYKS